MDSSDILTQWHINFYQENGFVQIDNIISPEEVEELRDYIVEAMRTEDVQKSYKNERKGSVYYSVLNQKINVWRDHGGMARYTMHPRFSEIAMKLSQSQAIRLFHDHALWKMPGDSKPTPWHQDKPYWPMNSPCNPLSLWLPLDDVDENNGCMMFMPRTHKIGELPRVDLRGATPTNLFDYAEGKGIETNKPVIVPMKVGSCTFHHGLTFHYAHANNTDKPRRVLAIIYMQDGTTYSGKEHMITDLDRALVKNQPLAGPLFPLLSRNKGAAIV